jgi:hypothetical protein
MESVVQLLHEYDQRTNVAVAQARPRIVAFELIDQPPRIINPDVKIIVRAPQKRAGELA